MVIDEVNAAIARRLLGDYLAWLRPHAQEMLSFDGFVSVEYFEVAEGATDADDRAQVCIQYRVTSKAALDDYLQNHAEAMRHDDGIEKFEGQLSRQWRVLSLIDRV